MMSYKMAQVTQKNRIHYIPKFKSHERKNFVFWFSHNKPNRAHSSLWWFEMTSGLMQNRFWFLPRHLWIRRSDLVSNLTLGRLSPFPLISMRKAWIPTVSESLNGCDKPAVGYSSKYWWCKILYLMMLFVHNFDSLNHWNHWNERSPYWNESAKCICKDIHLIIFSC